jgi:predicted nucleic acid-binding protein
MELVIDATIAIRWFEKTRDATANSALNELCERGAVVPALWRWEVQDVLRRLHRGGHTPLTLDEMIAEMTQLPIEIDDGSIGLFGAEAAFANRHELSVYDAAYLEVAVRRSLPLATLDKKLAAAAKREGVSYVASGPAS